MNISRYEDMIEELRRLLMSKTHALTNDYTSIPSNHIGYICNSIMQYSFIPRSISTGNSETIVNLTLPCKGIWNIYYDFSIFNPARIITTFPQSNINLLELNISFLSVAIVTGIKIETQSVDSILYLNDSSVKQLQPGESHQFNGNAIYVATDELSLSLNIQSNFDNLLYLSSNQSNIIGPYNLRAVRIG